MREFDEGVLLSLGVVDRFCVRLLCSFVINLGLSVVSELEIVKGVFHKLVLVADVILVVQNNERALLVGVKDALQLIGGLF